MKNIPVDSYIKESPKWEYLSIPEKAEMMKVAIRNGVTSLPEIKQAYKEFAEGGNLYKGGGKKRQASFGNAGSQRAMQYFMNKGLTQAQAAGLVGNLMRESGMQSTALNSSSKAFGIAQWLGPRKKALFARYGSSPTLDQQLDFVWHELNTTHRNGLRHLKASKTAAEAARNVMGYYEFSAGPEAAIAAMNRTGQAGNKSMLRGIEYASKLLGIPVSAEDYTPVVQESPLASSASDAQQMIQFTPWNPQAFYGYQAPQIEIPMEQPVQNIPTFTKEDVERAQRQQGMETFMALSNLLQPTGTPEAVVPRQRNNPYVAYQEGGNLFKEGGPKASSERIYDVLPRLYAMDGVNVIASSKLRKGSTVIKDGKDTGRPSRHASGLAIDIVPGKGSTFADMFRVLRDPNSNVSRYLQSVGGGYLDETSATGTTKYWHDHDRDHSHIHHQIGGYAGANYGKEIASILGGKAPMFTPSTQEQSTFLAFEPANPMAFFNPVAFQTPVIERPVVEPLVEEADVYSQKMQEIEDRRNNLNKLNMMLSLTSPSQSGNSLMSTIGMLTGNYSANGGPIHIKPSHRGRLTELKERTGKTEAELKHDGNPAHKKMVVFAENARKWHGLGGNLYDDGGLTDQQYYSIMEKVAEENNPKWNKFRIEEGGRPLSVDEDYMRILNDNSYDYRGYYNKYPNSAANADTHWNDEFKTAWHPSFSDQSIYSGKKSQYNPKGIVGGHWYGKDGDIFIPTIPQLVEQNKSYFGLGGHIYDGLTEGSQQMDNSYSYTKPLDTVYVNSKGDVLDLDVPSARGTIQLPEVTVSAPDWKDMVGRYNIASNDAITVANWRPVNTHLRKAFDEGAKAQAAWAKEHPWLETAGLIAGAAPLAVAAYPALAGAGELAYPVLTNPYVDAALTSAAAGHGLNHTINEGINGWGDAAMTALELAPLGRLAKPMWNAAKSIGNFIPTLESNMSGVRYAYNRNPELANIGTLEDYNDYLKTVFPESKVRDINYHMGPKGLQELKPSTGKVYNTNPDARGIYVTPDKSYAQRLRKYTTDRLEKPSFFTYIKRNLIPGGWDKANDVFTDIYPVMVDTKNPLLTKGTWTWGIKDKKYQSLMDDYDAIVNSGPKWYQNFNSMPETIVPKTEQSLVLGSDADVAGFRRFMSNPQITAENAASMTPEQTALASLNSDINPKLPMAVKALKANKQAVQDIAEMNKYHAANVAEYNKATGSNSTSIPFRTDIIGSQIKVLPDEEFNAAMRGKKTNSPSGNVENIGGLYSGIDDTTYLRAKGNPSTAYHEFLHRHRYGTTNPEVTRWRIDQLVDPERIKNLSPQLKQYYLSEMEFPVHLRQQGESMGIKVGQEFPGEEAFDELLFNSGRSGAATYAKGMDLDSPIEDKKLVWKALNGTLFGQAIPIIGLGAAGTLYGKQE